MTRLRGGTNELRIVTGRYPITNRDRRLEVEERRCLICMSERSKTSEREVQESFDEGRDRIWGRKEDRGRQEAADATTSRNRTTRREQGGSSQAAPRNFELLPRRYATAASRCFAAGPKNLKRYSLALFVFVNL